MPTTARPNPLEIPAIKTAFEHLESACARANQARDTLEAAELALCRCGDDLAKRSRLWDAFDFARKDYENALDARKAADKRLDCVVMNESSIAQAQRQAAP